MIGRSLQGPPDRDGPDFPALPPRAVLSVVLAAALGLAYPGRLSPQPASSPSGEAAVGPAAEGPGSSASTRAGTRAVGPPGWFRSGLSRSVRLEARVERPAPAFPGPAGPASGDESLPRSAVAGDASILSMAGLGALGGVLGFAAGGTLGGELGCSHDFCSVDGRIVGAWLGGSAGLSTGVHVANGLRGSWIASTGVSLGINGLTTLTAVDIRDSETTAVLIPLGAAVSLAGAVLIEKGSSDADEGPD